jgi:hypothetical protein
LSANRLNHSTLSTQPFFLYNICRKNRFHDRCLRTYAVKVDGSDRKAYLGLINWNEKKECLEIVVFSEEKSNCIEPGDVIVVPGEIKRIAWIRETHDIITNTDEYGSCCRGCPELF